MGTSTKYEIKLGVLRFQLLHREQGAAAVEIERIYEIIEAEWSVREPERSDPVHFGRSGGGCTGGGVPQD